MAWLHTWSGLVLGWLLLAIFATGLASYFKPEIHAWMRPELNAPADPVAAMARGAEWIGSHVAGVTAFSVMAPSARNPAMEAFWDAGGEFGDGFLDPVTGSPEVARETMGGEFFYRFHFELMMPYPWGRYLACIAAFTMLIAIISGIVTHKRIFKDFFTFRPRKGQRSWLDIHNVLGVMSLPFYLMISYTGLVTLMTLAMPFGVMANYGDDEDSYYAEFPGVQAAEPSGVAAPLTAIEPVLRDAAGRWGGGPLSWVSVTNAGDSAAAITVERGYDVQIGYRPDAFVYEGATGRLLAPSPGVGPALATEEVLYGLHVGRFSDVVLRWLYVLSGIAGYAMMATGLILWTVKRAPKHAALPTANRIVERLNVGTIIGVPVAMAAFFWANRLLPIALEGRAERESDVFLAALAAMLLIMQIVPRPLLWRGGCLLGAAAFLGLPVVNALTTARGLDVSLVAGDWAMAGFDLTLLAIGVLFVAAWAAIRRRQAA